MGVKLRNFRRKGTLHPASSAEARAEQALTTDHPLGHCNGVHATRRVPGLAPEDGDLISALGVAQTVRSLSAGLRRLACPHKTLR